MSKGESTELDAKHPVQTTTTEWSGKNWGVPVDSEHKSCVSSLKPWVARARVMASLGASICLLSPELDEFLIAIRVAYS
jgi:hypothetical protein